MVLKLDGFSHFLDRSFGVGSPIRLGYLSLVLSLKVELNDRYPTPTPKTDLIDGRIHQV